MANEVGEALVFRCAHQRQWRSLDGTFLQREVGAGRGWLLAPRRGGLVGSSTAREGAEEHQGHRVKKDRCSHSLHVLSRCSFDVSDQGFASGTRSTRAGSAPPSMKLPVVSTNRARGLTGPPSNATEVQESQPWARKGATVPSSARRST